MADTKSPRKAHSVRGAAEQLNCAERAIYKAIATGELKSFKFGKRRLIPDEELQRLVNRKMAEAA